MIAWLKSWRARLADFFVRHFLYSFKSTVLTFYTPVIIFFIFITGTVSYVLAVRQIEESVYNDIKNVVYQTTIYTDNRFSGVLEQMVALSNDQDILKVLNEKAGDIEPEDYLKIQAHVDTVRLFNSTIVDSVYINFNNGKFVFFRGDYDHTMLGFTYNHYRNAYNDSLNDVYWQNFLPKRIRENAESDQVIDVFKLFGRKQAKKNGIILFRLRYDFFEKVFGRSLVDDNGYLMLVSPEGVSTFRDIKDEFMVDAKTAKLLQETTEKEGRIEFDNKQGKKLIVIYDTLPTNKWKLAAVFTRESILDKVEYIKYTTLGVIILLMIIAVFLTNWLVNYITRPISGLVNRMKEIRGAKMGPVSGQPLNEVELLDQGVEDLMVHIRNLMAQINKDQNTKRHLELSVIQMQIHPHFLYNTLYSIKGLCDMGMNDEASTMITELANFFRVGLSCGNEIIRVEEEVSHVRSYLFIQEMRYGDKFSYEIKMEPEILSYSIIKLTLQPLVENAIYHGVKEKRGKGTILVTGCKKEDILYFEVKDDGVGMSEERLQELRKGLAETRLTPKKLGFGVYSVFERLRLHYGMEAGLEIQSELHVGTSIKVTIPCRILEGD